VSDFENPELPDLSSLPPPRLEPPTHLQSSAAYLPDSNWSYRYTVMVLLFGIVAGPLLGLIVVGIVGGRSAMEDIPPLALLSFQAVASLAAVAAASRFRGSRSWRRDFGFKFEPRHVWGIVAGMVLQIAVALLTLPLIQWLSEDDEPQQEIARIASELASWEIVLFGVLVAVVTPIFEEIVYRGMLLGRLVKSMSRRNAVLISSAVFSLTHLLDPNAVLVVPGLFLVGLVLGYLALRAGNIGLPIFAHMGTNGLAVLLLAFGDELEKLSETVEAFVRSAPF
jgi:membrane protease YdiL (CAAX protease family)